MHTSRRDERAAATNKGMKWPLSILKRTPIQNKLKAAVYHGMTGMIDAGAAILRLDDRL